MKKLYFMRHAQSEANAEHRYATPDTPLSDLGRQQAAAAGSKLKSEHIDLIISSDLRRTVETAELVADQIGYERAKIVLDPRLREVYRGDMVGQPAGGLKAYLAAAHLAGNPHHVETEKQVRARVSALLAEVEQRPEDTILLVGHQDSGLILEDIIRRRQDLPDLLNLDNAQPVLLIRNLTKDLKEKTT